MVSSKEKDGIEARSKIKEDRKNQEERGKAGNGEEGVKGGPGA